jgi:hypothetical protein
MATRTCRHCGKTKPSDAFYEYRPSKCIECMRAYSRRWQQANPERYKASLKRWHETNANTPEARAFKVRYMQAHNKRHPDQYAARLAVTKAIQRGDLIRQPCRECGDPNSQAHHHKGYQPEHWLDVVFLCRVHHRAAEPARKAS